MDRIYGGTYVVGVMTGGYCPVMALGSRLTVRGGEWWTEHMYGGTYVVGVMTGGYCPVRAPGSRLTVHGGEW